MRSLLICSLLVAALLSYGCDTVLPMYDGETAVDWQGVTFEFHTEDHSLTMTNNTPERLLAKAYQRRSDNNLWYGLLGDNDRYVVLRDMDETPYNSFMCHWMYGTGYSKEFSLWVKKFDQEWAVVYVRLEYNEEGRLVDYSILGSNEEAE